MLWAIAVGLLLRGLLFFSTPVQEDDYYRYLWDGAVLAHGISPYRYAPEDVRYGAIESDPDRQTLDRLVEESGEVIERINYSHLRTIYPPVAQAAFVLAYWVHPWSLTAWRLVLFAFDALTLFLLVVTLRRVGVSSLWVLAYWWNPVLLKEVYNSSHMEPVILPFVLIALLLASRGRAVAASGALGLAVGAKMWPVLLLPFVLREAWGEPRRFMAALLLFVAVVGVLTIPVWSAGIDEESGFAAYGRKWEMNDALYMVFLWGAGRAADLPGLGSVRPHTLARLLVMGVLAALVLCWIRRPVARPIELYERSLLIVAALFLLSPTQFPWYYLWLLPLLAIRPRWSLLLLTVLLPLYYLRFRFKALGNVGVFDNGIVWLEFAPVLICLAWEWFRGRHGRSAWLSEGEPA